MKIELNEIPVKEVYKGYKDSAENGVIAYNGLLNVRPAFQREFVYKDKQRDEVIKTIKKGFPLNVMYWVKSDTGYEMLDGQQRTISFCQYINGDYSIDYQYFHNLIHSIVWCLVPRPGCCFIVIQHQTCSSPVRPRSPLTVIYPSSVSLIRGSNVLFHSSSLLM